MKIKIMTFVLLLFCIFTMFTGCESILSNDKAANQELISKLKCDLSNDNKREFLEFTAEEIAQAMALSASFNLTVKVKEDKIYINDVLYSNITKINFHRISYDKDALRSTNSTVTDAEVSDIIKKIERCKSCYLLKNDEANIITAIYVIDGTYYFLTLLNNNNNELVRIYRASIKYGVGKNCFRKS